MITCRFWEVWSELADVVTRSGPKNIFLYDMCSSIWRSCTDIEAHESRKAFVYNVKWLKSNMYISIEGTTFLLKFGDVSPVKQSVCVMAFELLWCCNTSGWLPRIMPIWHEHLVRLQEQSRRFTHSTHSMLHARIICLHRTKCLLWQLWRHPARYCQWYMSPSTFLTPQQGLVSHALFVLVGLLFPGHRRCPEIMDTKRSVESTLRQPQCLGHNSHQLHLL